MSDAPDKQFCHASMLLAGIQSFSKLFWMPAKSMLA